QPRLAGRPAVQPERRAVPRVANEERLRGGGIPVRDGAQRLRPRAEPAAGLLLRRARRRIGRAGAGRGVGVSVLGRSEFVGSGGVSAVIACLACRFAFASAPANAKRQARSLVTSAPPASPRSASAAPCAVRRIS